MLHHFRFIAPLLPHDEDKISPLHYYDAAIQIARISEKEPSEEEFYTGMQAADEIMRWYVLSFVSVTSFHQSLFLPALRYADLIELQMYILASLNES
jgi:hypothetical protein